MKGLQRKKRKLRNAKTIKNSLELQRSRIQFSSGLKIMKKEFTNPPSTLKILMQVDKIWISYSESSIGNKILTPQRYNSRQTSWINFKGRTGRSMTK
jgi:hypothetical protein